MKEEKEKLRSLIARRKALCPPERREALSRRLQKLLEEHPRFAGAHTVLFYYSLRDEVQTHALAERWYREKRVLLPVVKGEELELRLYGGKETLKKGAYGIEEPAGSPFTAYEEIEVAVVPGVSFDREGNRLGRGKGYYDRLLPRLPFSYNIGICYSFQVSGSVPHEACDCPMDAVLTEEGWLFTER